MKIKLIYPAWPKLERQTEFHLPPHGPVVFAAIIPADIELVFEDENVEKLQFDNSADLIALSVMLTCQLPRAFEIAREYRARNIPVICGGIAATLHSQEVARHVDAIFIGEAEGHFDVVLEDFKRGQLKPVYDFLSDLSDVSQVGPARRNILNRSLYNYRGVQMLDLIHASRGCKFNCFPCCSGYLGGRQFRPRPIHKVIEEMNGIDNNHLFIVDNSLAQERNWLIELFTAMKPLKKKWVSHPIMYDKEVLKLAAEAGCWYVYQAIFDTSDVIRDRIKMLKDFGIGIEGTIILGTDEQDENEIKKLVDFLCKMEVDIAEFTILTPYPHSPIRHQMEQDGRILHNNWIDYSADKVVFKPLKITPEKLQELYYYAWDTFYADAGYELKMGRLFHNVMLKEIEDGTFRRYDRQTPRKYTKR
jgi:radical SAM superfamily enzyme YgiQ (UPF0313 family)